jgi:predicted nucleic acid-binding protein
MTVTLDLKPEVEERIVADFSEWERIVLQYQVSGKQAHDARLVAAMIVHDVTHLLTFNTADFKRFTTITTVNPQSISNQ